MVRLVSAAVLAALLGCATVPAGAGGVLWTPGSGVSPEPLGEGQHFIGPFADLEVYDLRAQEHGEDLVGLSAEGAPLEASASVVTLHLVAAELPALDRQIGPDYYQIVVAPLIRSGARRVLSRYLVSDLDSAAIRRAQAELAALVAPALRTLHIVLDGVVFRRVISTAPAAYAAVLATSQAEQVAMQARADIEAAAQRAEERREQGRGLAAGLDIVAPTLTRESLAEAQNRAWQRLILSPSTSVVVRPQGETPLLLEVHP